MSNACAVQFDDTIIQGAVVAFTIQLCETEFNAERERERMGDKLEISN